MAINPISQSNQFEFNDSVLDTHAWKSSRYTGRQLQGAEINKYTVGDVSYAHTPVVSNYTRNIYLGSRVIGMGESLSTEVEDASLLIYQGFSYITIHEYITVNDDLSVTRHSVITNDSIAKKGWYKPFYQDFPIKSEVSLNFLDENLETSLDSSYNVFFNGGQLRKLLNVREDDNTPGNDYAITYSTSSNMITHKLGSGFTGTMDASFTIYNKENIIDRHFTGSLLTNFRGKVSSTAPPQGK